MDNRPLPVISEGGGHVALVTGPCAFSATLEVGAALSFSPGRGAFLLPVPPRRASPRPSTCRATRPTCISPPASSFGRSSANGRTTIEATLQPGTPAEVWWSTHDSAPASRRGATCVSSPTSSRSSPSATPTCAWCRSSTSRSSRGTVADCRRDSRRLRGGERERRLAGADRDAAAACGVSCPIPRSAVTSSCSTWSAAQAGLVHARDRLPDASRRAARSG